MQSNECSFWELSSFLKSSIIFTSNYVHIAAAALVNFRIVPYYGGRHEQRVRVPQHRIHKHAAPRGPSSILRPLNIGRTLVLRKFNIYNLTYAVKSLHLMMRRRGRRWHIIAIPKRSWEVSSRHWTATFWNLKEEV